MKKKLTALFLALIMCMTLGISAIASDSTLITDTDMTQNEHDDIIRAEVLRQLEAQDALHLYDAFEAILFPQNSGNAQTYATSSWEVNAPNGGVLYYKLPYTYRGEDGVYDYAITHFDEESTDKFTSNWSTGMNVMSAISIAVGTKAPTLGTAMSTVLLAATLEKDWSQDLIDDAGGYAQILAVCASIDNSSAAIVLGWDTYPIAVVEEADAYQRQFVHFTAD